MEITDSHIAYLKASATLTEAINLAQKSIGEMTRMEGQCRTKRLEMEVTLGHLIAQKLMLDMTPPR